MKNKFDSLDSEAVIHLGHCAFKISELVSAIVAVFQQKCFQELNSRLKSQERGYLPSTNTDIANWLNNGVNCEILKPGKSWQTGKVKIKFTFEFCPDEPEVSETNSNNQLEIGKPASPLDDIRQMMKEENQQNIYE